MMTVQYRIFIEAALLHYDTKFRSTKNIFYWDIHCHFRMFGFFQTFIEQQ